MRISSTSPGGARCEAGAFTRNAVGRNSHTSFPFCSGMDYVAREVWTNKSICITCNCSKQKLVIINFVADATDYSKYDNHSITQLFLNVDHTFARISCTSMSDSQGASFDPLNLEFS